MSKSHAPTLPQKTIIVVLLEDILFPGTINPAVDAERVQKFLKSMQKYVDAHPGMHYYGVSALKVGVCQKKITEFGLEKFFTSENTFAVDAAFIHKMTELDRELYEKKCKEDETCKDEYARQVQLQDLMQKQNIPSEKVLFIGHDYWFDGFYTRRFSKVDMVFIESALSSKGHIATERVEGLWHVPLDWDELLPFIEGKGTPIDYKRLDEFVVTTISKELFGGQGFSLQKKVIDLRKIKDAQADESKLPDVQ